LKVGDVGLMIRGIIEGLKIIQVGYLLSYELDLTIQEHLKTILFY